MSISRLIVLPLFLCACACAAHKSASTGPSASSVQCLELAHQILFENRGEQQVFEGTMIQAGDSFVVRAFAGPGIDLFTVTRTPLEASQEAHVPGLANRVDIVQVGDDIARVYRAGCGGPFSTMTACQSGKEPLEEWLGESGEILRRHYPSAHGTGLTIVYEQRETLCGQEMPRRIVLSWGKAERRMVIFTAGCKACDGLPKELSSNNKPAVDEKGVPVQR